MGQQFKMLKQLQQMQAKMAKIQEELGEKTVTGTAGGGMVEVVANGHQKVLSVIVKPEGRGAYRSQGTHPVLQRLLLHRRRRAVHDLPLTQARSDRALRGGRAPRRARHRTDRRVSRALSRPAWSLVTN